MAEKAYRPVCILGIFVFSTFPRKACLSKFGYLCKQNFPAQSRSPLSMVRSFRIAVCYCLTNRSSLINIPYLCSRCSISAKICCFQPAQPPKKAAATTSSGQGKAAKKKKWSKGKVKDKAQHSVVLDKTTYDRILKDVPTFRFISTAILIERLKINGSLARIAIHHLEKEGSIKRIAHHHGQLIYSTCQNSVLGILFSVLKSVLFPHSSCDWRYRLRITDGRTL